MLSIRFVNAGKVLLPRQAENVRYRRVGYIEECCLPTHCRSGIPYSRDRVSNVMLTITEGSFPILPRFPPMDGGQTYQDGAREHRCEAPYSFTFGHAAPFQTMVTGGIMVDTGLQSLHRGNDRVALRGMKVAARWVTSQGPAGLFELLPGGKSESQFEQGSNAVSIDRRNRSTSRGVKLAIWH
jgi:hypothetical protein